jgi:hypothetical protein
VLKSSALMLAVSLAVPLSPTAPASARAGSSRALSIATARRAITVYEGAYWTGQGVRLTVGGCRRHGASRVSCLVEAGTPGQTAVIRDWAILLRQGIIRVHPGDFAITITLESESPAVAG